jgi:hypothetical protein
MTENQSRPESPAIPLLIVAAACALMAGIGVRVINLHFKVGPWILHHWLTWVAALFILAFTPIFYMRRRRNRANDSTLLRMHIYGGLLAWLLASLHFMQHVTKPAESYPNLGTGVVLYGGLVLSVLTGFLMRYRLAAGGMREWYLIHTGAAGTFFLSIVIHILKGLKIL